MKIDLSNFSGWVIYEKGTIVATYDKENFHRYYDQEEIRILQQENKQLKEKNKHIEQWWKETNVIIRNEKSLAVNDNAMNYIESLEHKIDKAIEYIKHSQSYGTMAQVMPHLKPYVNGDDLLEILGDKENEI